MILRIRTEEIFCSTLDKEDFYMKPVKKILALILAGVMALAMLTGCGKATSPDRAVAESVVDWLKYACSRGGKQK